MKSIIRYGTAAAALAAALTLTMAPAAQAADGVYKITPETKTVGVHVGDTIKFVDQQTGQSFTEHFDTESQPFDLNQIAPAGALGGQHVTVYVWGENGAIDG
jgi:hypothetical protein